MERKRILLVEDEEIIRNLCRRILADYELTIASSVVQARQLMDGKAWDLLITDLKLPDGTGINVIQSFRKNPDNSHAIVITGSLDPKQELTEDKDLGVAEVVFKPFELEDFQNAVTRTLNGEKR